MFFQYLRGNGLKHRKDQLIVDYQTLSTKFAWPWTMPNWEGWNLFIFTSTLLDFVKWPFTLHNASILFFLTQGHHPYKYQIFIKPSIHYYSSVDLLTAVNIVGVKCYQYQISDTQFVFVHYWFYNSVPLIWNTDKLRIPPLGSPWCGQTY